MQEEYLQQSENVARYYDEWQHAYDEVYGDTIQAFRPSDKEDLMTYIARSAGIGDNQNILDAGCGVGGPLIWLARHFNVKISGLTISQLQAKRANESITKEGLSARAETTCGDYHLLSKLFEKDSFDRALFLESLGHAANPSKVIHEAYSVLKPGGSIYIKDFYYKESEDEHWRNRIARAIGNINRLYNYNCLNLNQTLTALRGAGFEIDFIKKFDFKDDISVRFAFESRYGIDIFGGEPEFTPAEWLEIKCFKPI